MQRYTKGHSFSKQYLLQLLNSMWTAALLFITIQAYNNIELLIILFKEEASQTVLRLRFVLELFFHTGKTDLKIQSCC